MNQLNIDQIMEIAGSIRNLLQTKKLRETTLDNLIAECQPRDDVFFLALDWLARKNEIFFLKTPKETYVLPAN